MIHMREYKKPLNSPHPIFIPKHLGYYMKCELSPEPYEVIKEVYQLDKALIRKINNTEGDYRFTGEAKCFDNEHDEDPIVRNTVVLENYVNRVKPRMNQKLRIFARGGPLCTFLTAEQMRIHIGHLDFDYNEEENVLRLYDTMNVNTSFGFTMMARHRLTGNKSETVEYGMNTIYRVMELITPWYDLFYCKEIDGFDGDEPIEIRRAQKDWYLNGMKFCYKSAALAAVNKVGILVEGDEKDTIHRVTISDDFSQIYYRPESARERLFHRIYTFFRLYIPILKFFKSGDMTRAPGGTIIEPDFVEPFRRKNTRVITNKLELETLEEDEKVMLRLEYPTTRDLCDLMKTIGRNRILACLLESGREEVSKTLLHWWKATVEDINPDLTRPADLATRDVWVFSPYFGSPPILRNAIIFNNEGAWSLSQTENVLVGPKREDIERLLEQLVKPLPTLMDTVYMKVYTQEACEDLLSEYFGDMITFAEPEENEPIIFCMPMYLPHDQDFRAGLLAKYTNARKDQHTADLYLIGRNPAINPAQKWDNKGDLEYLETFLERGGPDPVRKFPRIIALFSKDQEEISRVEEVLKESHNSLVKVSNQTYTIFQVKE